MRKKFQQSLLRYFDGNKILAKEFIKECRSFDLDLSDEEVLNEIHAKPHHLTLLLTYSNLGLLRKIAESVDGLKPQNK